ncbi:MAG: bifunctional phosphoribosyl-AMP cyclohydrolase/phosphoribosyl-ATP diphosphatase HisIE [Gammaproteobacteria bacterium]
MTAFNPEDLKQLLWPTSGLLPVVVQDYHNDELLMQAWVNQQALQQAIEQQRGVYFSRSRNRIWVKGEQSGNSQRLVEVRTDCDKDCLQYLVEQKGPACHLGARSCFFHSLAKAETPPLQTRNTDILSQIQELLEQRKQSDPDQSYVAKLYHDGLETMLSKCTEEAEEVVEAAREVQQGQQPVSRLVAELADLWFHSLVLLHSLDGQTTDILAELNKRAGVSGLTEKRNRKT